MTDLRNGSDQYPNVRLQHSIDSNPLQTQIQPQKQWKEFNKALKDQIYSWFLCLSSSFFHLFNDLAGS